MTTDGEVYAGRIKDNFTPVIKGKMSKFGCEMLFHEILNDDHTKIKRTIFDLVLTQIMGRYHNHSGMAGGAGQWRTVP